MGRERSKIEGNDMKTTEILAEYTLEIGADIKKMSKATGIPYEALYDSLRNKNRRRPLRADEFLAVCRYLGKDPNEFMGGMIRINGRAYREINISVDGELVASIGDSTIIEKKGVTVVCVPFFSIIEKETGKIIDRSDD